MPKSNNEVPWESRITKVKRNSLVTHGIDQVQIIREFSFEEMVYFLILGKRPMPKERNLLRAVLVAHISHGITGQSTLAVMQAADCRSDFLHALVGGFSVGAGVYHQGGLRAAMVELRDLAKLTELELAARLSERLQSGEHIIGYGHRFHRKDPRVETLLKIAQEEGFSGPHMRTALKVHDFLWEKKRVAMNIEAAGGSILLDLGFDPIIGHLFIVLGRSPMFAAVYLERLAQGRQPFQKIRVYDVLEDSNE